MNRYDVDPQIACMVDAPTLQALSWLLARLTLLALVGVAMLAWSYW